MTTTLKPDEAAEMAGTTRRNMQYLLGRRLIGTPSKGRGRKNAREINLCDLLCAGVDQLLLDGEAGKSIREAAIWAIKDAWPALAKRSEGAWLVHDLTHRRVFVYGTTDGAGKSPQEILAANNNLGFALDIGGLMAHLRTEAESVITKRMIAEAVSGAAAEMGLTTAQAKCGQNAIMATSLGELKKPGTYLGIVKDGAYVVYRPDITDKAGLLADEPAFLAVVPLGNLVAECEVKIKQTWQQAS